jgi:hypothetical protein
MIDDARLAIEMKGDARPDLVVNNVQPVLPGKSALVDQVDVSVKTDRPDEFVKQLQPDRSVRIILVLGNAFVLQWAVSKPVVMLVVDNPVARFQEREDVEPFPVRELVGQLPVIPFVAV